jgi:serine/threonine protein kinase
VSESRPPLDVLPVGYRLDDFRIIEVLGKGGFGITYKAIDERLERQVAIKEYLPRDYAFRGEASAVLPRGDAEKPTFEWGLARFVDEARALALFRHRNIISVLRYLEANGTAYLVMEYEEGEDLDRWLQRHSTVTESQLVTEILLPVLDGLEKVHTKNLLHRDIKPGNIFIRTDGSPVLIDFGASRAHGAQASTNMTAIVSAGYSPFEQYGGGNSKQGPWTDLYALAGTMYRMISGLPPVDAIGRMQGQPFTPAVEIGRGRYSAGVLAAIDRALSLDAKDRPQSVAEFRALVTGSQPKSARDPNATTVVQPGATAGTAHQRSSAPRIVMFSALVVVVAAAAWYFVADRGTSLPEPSAAVSSVESPPPQPGEPQGNSNNVTEAQSTTPPAQVAPPTEAQVATVEPQAKIEAAPLEPVNPEDQILIGLDMPPDMQAQRQSHISGTLLAYVQTKLKFDECQKTQPPCKESASLLQATLANQEGSWKAPNGCESEACSFTGTVRVTNPRRLDREDCPFLIDVTEVLRHAGAERKQTRTYCTANGFNRQIDSVGPVT